MSSKLIVGLSLANLRYRVGSSFDFNLWDFLVVPVTITLTHTLVRFQPSTGKSYQTLLFSVPFSKALLGHLLLNSLIWCDSS